MCRFSSKSRTSWFVTRGQHTLIVFQVAFHWPSTTFDRIHGFNCLMNTSRHSYMCEDLWFISGIFPREIGVCREKENKRLSPRDYPLSPANYVIPKDQTLNDFTTFVSFLFLMPSVWLFGIWLNYSFCLDIWTWCRQKPCVMNKMSDVSGQKPCVMNKMNDVSGLTTYLFWNLGALANKWETLINRPCCLPDSS